MKLNNEEQNTLIHLFDEVIEGDRLHELNNFQRKFITSNHDQFLNDKDWKGEGEYFVSIKMWNIFREIGEKVGVHVPHGRETS